MGPIIFITAPQRKKKYTKLDNYESIDLILILEVNNGKLIKYEMTLSEGAEKYLTGKEITYEKLFNNTWYDKMPLFYHKYSI